MKEFIKLHKEKIKTAQNISQYILIALMLISALTVFGILIFSVWQSSWIAGLVVTLFVVPVGGVIATDVLLNLY